jgi:hypothetical protein
VVLPPFRGKLKPINRIEAVHRMGVRMDPEFRRMVIDRDEVGIEELYFEDECPHVFNVDWREDDAAIVEYCADCLDLDALTAEWRGEDLFATYAGKTIKVPLRQDEGDRHITICALNNMR